MGHRLWDLAGELGAFEFTDLTHGFAPGIPRGPGLPDEVRNVLIDFDSPYRARVIHHELVGQWGTHVDAPRHFHPGGRSLDELPVRESLLPLVVVDVHAQAGTDPDYEVTLADLHAWEDDHGRIPAGSFVALRTDWAQRWGDVDAFLNLGEDGLPHRPGWSGEALEWLVGRRDVAAVGHETPDTDAAAAAARAGDFVLERYLLGTGRWQIEMLARLAGVPPAGALLLTAWPKAVGGVSFPARAVAIHAAAPGGQR